MKVLTMSVECVLCGDWKHSAPACKASEEKKLAFRLLAMANHWRAAELNGEGDYFNGKESGTRQCGEDLYEVLTKFMGRDKEPPTRENEERSARRRQSPGSSRQLIFNGLPRGHRNP